MSEEMRSKEGIIEGTVSTEENDDIEAAVITVTDTETEELEAVITTEESGTYSVSVGPGTYDVRCEQIGFETDEQSVTVGDDTTETLDITLSELASDVEMADELEIGLLASGDHATVGGGLDNEARGRYDTVAGGWGNVADGQAATISGGAGNEASNTDATVGGGVGNKASGFRATIGGGGGISGAGNTASGSHSTVGGGRRNHANGSLGTVPGGSENVAHANNSFAAGRRAYATHEGAVVFADSSNTYQTSDGENEIRSQMPVFAPAFNSTSATSAKTNVESVDPETVLDGVEGLEITTWNFKHNGTGKHMGPMAEEFAETFDLGDDDESISTVDAEGVALAAIQGLSKKLAERDDRIAE
ncbi:carboxypeptidase regulatory-like domain-containing protein, partial [Natronococcus sp. A-GB7]|uniref:carboxypeptidase regulatory-like domain-containing protein n=1 Tax=Natronococcus sp. A-GB7 TaxID=3037649 RepID=UPI00241CDD23